MPSLTDSRTYDAYTLLVWRRFMAEALQRLLTQHDGALSMKECLRRARISAGLRLHTWMRSNPYRATAVA